MGLADKLLSLGRTNPVEQLGKLPLWQKILEAKAPQLPAFGTQPSAAPTPQAVVPLWQKILGGQPNETFLQTYKRTGEENTAATRAAFDPNASPELRAKGQQKLADMAFGFSGGLQNIAKKGVGKALTSTVDDLAREARKYKTAEEFVNAQQPTKVTFQSATKKADYMGGHEAPMAEDINAPIWDLTGKYTGNKLYPDDIYSDNARRLYSSGSEADPQAISILQSVKGRPNARVTVYRAVPKDAPSELNAGDWITLTREYAKEHGESNLGNNFKIIKKEIKTRDIFTDANSIQEFGYDPQPMLAPKDTPYELLSKAYKDGKVDLHSQYQSQLIDIWNKANK